MNPALPNTRVSGTLISYSHGYMGNYDSGTVFGDYYGVTAEVTSGETAFYLDQVTGTQYIWWIATDTLIVYN